MPDLFYFHQDGKAKVVELVPGVVKGRRVFMVPLSRGRQVCVAGELPEVVIPQLKVLLSRGGLE
jgi:hypothetical protein